MECCGHDGTYAMKTESFEASIRIGEKAFSSMKEAGAEVWATDCPLAAIQFNQHAGKTDAPDDHPCKGLSGRRFPHQN